MPTGADNHVALRVSDIDRAIQFYVEALDGELLAAPAETGGRFLEDVFGPGVRVKVCHVGFERGGALELWQFLEPSNPIPPADQHLLGQMHFGLTVDDVEESLRRVEDSGGRRRFEPRRVVPGGPLFVYCEDPDGNVFELLGAAHREVVRMILEADPSLVPA